jgi:hypothetical protein
MSESDMRCYPGYRSAHPAYSARWSEATVWRLAHVWIRSAFEGERAGSGMPDWLDAFVVAADGFRIAGSAILLATTP